MNKILVVEDDKKLNQFVCSALSNSGYATVSTLNATDALDCMYSQSFDLIISDIMMPHIDGFEFAGMVRNINKDIPILFMTSRDDFSAKEQGFQIGIDDYMVKPIDVKELILRVGALLRRANIMTTQRLTIGNLVMNADTLSAFVGEKALSLTLREFNILYKLLSYPDRPFSRAQLMNEFWDVDSDTTLRAVDVYITKLRNKLCDCNGFKIVTVYGLGYKAVLV
ncbi:response regulator transcription factor [[Clostridium] innocuum]|nr:response regulator transcription factor [[Clostridium] innocuum]